MESFKQNLNQAQPTWQPNETLVLWKVIAATHYNTLCYIYAFCALYHTLGITTKNVVNWKNYLNVNEPYANVGICFAVSACKIFIHNLEVCEHEYLQRIFILQCTTRTVARIADGIQIQETVNSS